MGRNSVYYPVFLSQYELVRQGFWRGYSYGMVVFSLEDFKKLAGFDLTKIGWGDEDVELYNQFLSTESVNVIRSVQNFNYFIRKIDL